jgi:hypothetical protein
VGRKQRRQIVGQQLGDGVAGRAEIEHQRVDPAQIPRQHPGPRQCFAKRIADRRVDRSGGQAGGHQPKVAGAFGQLHERRRDLRQHRVGERPGDDTAAPRVDRHGRDDERRQ